MIVLSTYLILGFLATRKSLNKSCENLGKAFLCGKDSIAYDDAVAALLSEKLMSKDNNESKKGVIVCM